MKQNLKKELIRVRIDLLANNPADPFKPYGEDKLTELAESIAEHGLFEPIIVKARGDGGYEILAGKNRAGAFRLKGWDEIDAFVVEADDDEAAMIITDSNLKHRDRLLPSERAFAYKMQLDALKRQGIRTDKFDEGTFGLIDQKFNSRKIIAEHNSVNENDIKRYLRLTYLIPELLSLVDNDTLQLYAAVDLSFLDERSQRTVHDYFFADGYLSLDLERSGAIKKAFREKGTLTAEMIEELFFAGGVQRTRVVPIVNRKLLSSLITETELPDDETLLRLFAEFLREKFKATGSINIVRRETETIF